MVRRNDIYKPQILWDAYWSGMTARESGKSIEENPYDKNLSNKQWIAWRCGWLRTDSPFTKLKVS